MSLTVYQYPKCSTCRKALKWLDAQGIPYQSVHIVDAPPSAAALKKLIKQSGLPLRAFFNTSGESYREGGYKDRLPTMSEAEAASALAADGKLIKRPLALTGDTVLLGFDEAVWKHALKG
jgi:arsenate reductase (glutaredoxin)